MSWRSIIAFFESPLVGFLLKLVGGAGSAVFGIFGLGTKARDDAGTLTTPGWVALIGILVSGGIAILSSSYDFITGRIREDNDRLRSERLMLEIERGIYPLRSIHGNLEIKFAPGMPGFKKYEATLRHVIPTDSHCHPTSDYGCEDIPDGSIVYKIPASSPLAPKPDSLAGVILNNLGVTVYFMKPFENRGTNYYKKLGSFTFTFDEIHPKDANLFFNPKTGFVGYAIGEFEVPDNTAAKSNVYSLSEIFPGLVAANATIPNLDLCDGVRPTLRDECNAALPGPAWEGITLENILLGFQYPKALRLAPSADFECHSATLGDLLIRALPESVEQDNYAGNFEDKPKLRVQVDKVCKAINDEPF
jgi:hypothetical protein